MSINRKSVAMRERLMAQMKARPSTVTQLAAVLGRDDRALRRWIEKAHAAGLVRIRRWQMHRSAWAPVWGLADSRPDAIQPVAKSGRARTRKAPAQVAKHVSKPARTAPSTTPSAAAMAAANPFGGWTPPPDPRKV